MTPFFGMSNVNYEVEPGSFRDRNGRIYIAPDAVYRGLNQTAVDQWNALYTATFFRKMHQEGRIIGTERVVSIPVVDSSLIETWSGFLKHEKVPFVSYPYEWPFEMLKDAALLHLDLLEAALADDFILKDSSAFNIQYIGSKPVFIDVPSFERLVLGEPWVGFRQFCQMFLYPLMLQAYRGIPYQAWLRGHIDGIEPADCWNMMSLRDLVRPGVLSMVYMQTKLLAAFGGSVSRIKEEVRDAGFSKRLIIVNLRKVRRVVECLSWGSTSSEWSNYDTTHSYHDADFQLKIDFVRTVVQEKHRRLAWDVGCNAGTFSRVLAENTDYVVAMDMDPLVVQKLYGRLRTEGNATILPLVCNVADPSPNLGWRGLERKGLVERGKPELTLCLALIHHIVIGANIPMTQFIEWLASLGTDLVIEMVTKEDAMVQKLLLNKQETYRDYDAVFLETCLNRYFQIKARQVIQSGTRILYHAVHQ